MTHDIRICGYVCGVCGPLVLGTRGSYGAERLRFSFDEAWDGLEKIVTLPAGTQGAVRVPVPDSGEIDVPHEATAEAGRHQMVVRGIRDGAELYTVGILYRVMNRPGADGGAAQEPTPDALAQYITATRDDRLAAEEAAHSAEASAEAAQEAADDAKESAGEAEASAARYPVVRNGTWWVWQGGADGAYVDTGQPAQGPEGRVQAMTNREIDEIFNH